MIPRTLTPSRSMFRCSSRPTARTLFGVLELEVAVHELTGVVRESRRSRLVEPETLQLAVFAVLQLLPGALQALLCGRPGSATRSSSRRKETRVPGERGCPSRRPGRAAREGGR